MSFTTDAATARFAREMVASETTIAEALVAAASLLHTAALASREFSDLPALKGQATFLHLNKMVTGLIDARGEALRVHSQLLDIGQAMGATESPYCPPRNSIEAEHQHAA